MNTWALVLGFGLLFWTWLGYPLAVRLLDHIRPALRTSGESFEGRVSIILPVRDIDPLLRNRLSELATVFRSRPEMELLVVLDGCKEPDTLCAAAASDDCTIRTIELEDRVGKSLAQNRGVEAASGTILVLNDLGSSFTAAALEALLAPFVDDRVGYVAGNLRWRQPDSGAVESAGRSYTGWERDLWAAEARANLLHVAPGGFMALRRSLFHPLGPDVGDDAMLPMDVVGQGFRGAFAPEAVAVDDFSSTLGEELRSRIRMTSRSLRATLRGVRRWSLWRRPLLLMAIASHRILRWSTPIWLLLILIGAAPTISHAASTVFRHFLVEASVSAGIAALLLSFTKLGRRIMFLGLTFLTVNLGFLAGMLHYLFGGAIHAYGGRDRAKQ